MEITMGKRENLVDSRPTVERLAEAINRGRFWHHFKGKEYQMSFFHEVAAKCFVQSSNDKVVFLGR
jgi:hypothetical protein